MPSLLSSAADGCWFPTRLEGFPDMITAFARLRGLGAVEVDEFGTGWN